MRGQCQLLNKNHQYFQLFHCQQTQSLLITLYLTDAANIQESNSVNYFNLCVTIWMVRIFEGTAALSRVLF
jgi:hypothetical protein